MDYTPKELHIQNNNKVLSANYCQPNRHDEKMYRGTTYGYNFDFVDEKRQRAFTTNIANDIRNYHNSRENNRILGVKLSDVKKYST